MLTLLECLYLRGSDVLFHALNGFTGLYDHIHVYTGTPRCGIGCLLSCSHVESILS